MRRFMTEAIPLFERAGGHKVAIRFALTREMQAEIEAGAVFDVALLPRPAIDALVQSGKVASGTPIDVVRSLVGLMVRTGEPAPNIGTVDKFTDLLRRAQSISYSIGPSGQYVGRFAGKARACPRNEGENRARYRPPGGRSHSQRGSRNRYAADHRKSAGKGRPSGRPIA